MREFKYGVGVIATIFLLNLLLVKLSEKSSTKTDFRGKNQKDVSHDGNKYVNICFRGAQCIDKEILIRKISNIDIGIDID